MIDFHFLLPPLLLLFPHLSVRFGSTTSSPAAFWHRGSMPPSTPTSETLPCYWGTLFRGTTSMLPSLWGQRKQSYETNFPIGMLQAVQQDSNVSSHTPSCSGWHTQPRVVLIEPESDGFCATVFFFHGFHNGPDIFYCISAHTRNLPCAGFTVCRGWGTGSTGLCLMLGKLPQGSVQPWGVTVSCW